MDQMIAELAPMTTPEVAEHAEVEALRELSAFEMVLVGGGTATNTWY